MHAALREGGAPRRAPRRRPARRAGEQGSQALELAMMLPAVVIIVLLVAQAGVLGADVVAAQGLARDAARTAAVGGAEDVDDLAREAAGSRAVEIRLQPPEPQPGTSVTAEVRLRSRAFGNVGVEVWLPARATMLTEETG